MYISSATSGTWVCMFCSLHHGESQRYMDYGRHIGSHLMSSGGVIKRSIKREWHKGGHVFSLLHLALEGFFCWMGCDNLCLIHHFLQCVFICKSILLFLLDLIVDKESLFCSSSLFCCFEIMVGDAFRNVSVLVSWDRCHRHAAQGYCILLLLIQSFTVTKRISHSQQMVLLIWEWKLRPPLS